MKKLLLLLTVCLAGLHAMAEMPVHFGIHGGVSSNRIKFAKSLSELKTQADKGFMVGAFLRLNTKIFYLEPSFNYSRQKSIAGADDQHLDIKLENNTFEIPLMLGVKILDLSLFKLRAFLGPQVFFGKLKNIKKLPGNLSPDKTNWSGRAGIGIDLWKVTFDVDYEKGFHKMAPEIKAPRSYNFTLGFKII